MPADPSDDAGKGKPTTTAATSAHALEAALEPELDASDGTTPAALPPEKGGPTTTAATSAHAVETATEFDVAALDVTAPAAVPPVAATTEATPVGQSHCHATTGTTNPDADVAAVA